MSGVVASPWLPGGDPNGPCPLEPTRSQAQLHIFGGIESMMHRGRVFLLGVFFLTVLCLFQANPLLAQGGATGAISGLVVDSSGGAVGDAEVQILSRATETVIRTIPTASDGSFVAPLLPPGIYSVVVNKSGFSEAKAEGIDVRVTETTRVTITLKPGGVAEKVEIIADVAAVETSN